MRGSIIVWNIEPFKKSIALFDSRPIIIEITKSIASINALVIRFAATYLMLEMNDFFIEEGINTHVYPDNKGNYLVGTHSKSEIEKIYNKLYTSSNLFMKRKRTKFNEIMTTSR